MECWSHLRREFFKITERGDAPIATEAVARIARIYAIDKDVRGANAEAGASKMSASAPIAEVLGAEEPVLTGSPHRSSKSLTSASD